MALISLEFLLFVILAVAGYYLIPRRFQWQWLLGFSYLYYASHGPGLLIFLLFSTLTTWAAGKYLGKTEDKKKRKHAMVLTLVLNFGVLAVLKYTNFLIINLNRIFEGNLSFVDFVLPIGISFYTFQSMGYLLDVYWKKCAPEQNVFRFALFVSFFPQILQGPIGRYSRLAGQLFESHRWDWKRAEEGFQRILWGFFKKMVLADTAAPFVTALFDEYETYPGLAVFAVLAYSIHLYGDFSGGIDVVVGIGRLFGITMDENFKRPYFARSITDFWHRWHITLGTWMKDYVFYPVSLSGWMNRFGKFAKKKFGRSTGRTLPICLANLIVFFVVGVWHGAAWKFIVYGLYNGGIIAFSGLMAANYRKWKKACRIREDSAGWQVFQILRTFLLVNISWFFDRADNIPQALQMMKNSVTRWNPAQLLEVPIGLGGTSGYTVLALAILAVGVVILFLVSLLEERGIDVFARLAAGPAIFRLAVYLAFLFMIPMLGQQPGSSGGFIYAQF
ncbi:MAG: MBOAT family protein [Clostridiales bacterium]|nr:MBOAT family protein [Clostridiales bacterium]